MNREKQLWEPVEIDEISKGEGVRTGCTPVGAFSQV